jgi:hypothetical protein
VATVNPPPCPSGSFCPAGASNYTACAASTWSAAAASACILCSAGFYCTSGQSISCPRAFFCPAGVSNPIPCPAFTYSLPGSFECLSCISADAGGDCVAFFNPAVSAYTLVTTGEFQNLHALAPKTIQRCVNIGRPSNSSITVVEQDADYLQSFVQVAGYGTAGWALVNETSPGSIWVRIFFYSVVCGGTKYFCYFDVVAFCRMSFTMHRRPMQLARL